MSGAIVGQTLPTSPARWVWTAAVLVGALLASWLIRQAGRWLRDNYDPRGSALEAVQAALIVGLSAAAIVAVLWIWDARTEAQVITEAFRPTTRNAVRALIMGFLFVGVWGATVFAKRIIHLVFEAHDAFSRHQREVGYHVVQLCLYLAAVAVSVALWGVDISDLLLGAGFLSVVVGLAARQTLASVLAGFVLLFGRPFDIGDWIAVENHEGVVTDVSIVNTEVRTFNDEVVTIPNDVVTSRSLRNRSRRGQLRIDVEIGVDYNDDIDHAREVATEAMRNLDIQELCTHPEPEAVLTGFGDSAVVMELRFWVDNPTADRRWAAQSAVVRAVKDAFDSEGITIPFPQRTVGTRSTGESVTETARPTQPGDST